MTRTKLVLALASLALMAPACSRPALKSAAAVASPAALPADVRQVATVAAPSAAPSGAAVQLETSLTLTGELVSPVSSELVVRTPGRVAHIFADEGQRVRQGQKLLELETDYLRIEVQRATAEVARAEAAAREAQRDFERKQGLLAKASVSQALHDRSQGAAEQAAAGLQAAQATLALARQKLDDAVLTAPIDGVLAERRTDVGERLGEGSVAFVIQQTAPLKLRFRVPERYLTALREGQPVLAYVDPYPGRSFKGRVSLIGGSVDAKTRTFLVEAELLNRDGKLRPGLFARVETPLSGK